MCFHSGSTQNFKVTYWEKGKENYKESSDISTDLKTGNIIRYTINGLNAKTEYEITVSTRNQFNNKSESDAPVQTVITEGKILTDHYN